MGFEDGLCVCPGHTDFYFREVCRGNRMSGAVMIAEEADGTHG